LMLELEYIGYKVCGIAATGDEAIQITKENNPDLILMDITLIGDMDGIEAAEKILQFQKIPIIFMTGYARIEFDERVKKINPLGYYNKPLETETLQPVIDQLFAS
jgi:two-component system, response regulator PdtaR